MTAIAAECLSPRKSVSARAAIQGARLCAIAFDAREAIRAGRNPVESARGPRTASVCRCIKSGMQASLILRTLIPECSQLVGVGATNLVFRRGPEVEKLGIYDIGLDDEALEARIQLRAAGHAKIRAALGPYALQTTYRHGTIRLRLPGSPWSTCAATQRHIPNAVDVFSEAGKMVVAQNGRRIRQNLSSFAARAADMLKAGYMVDLAGSGNLVFGNGELILLDGEPIPAYAFNRIDPKVNGTYSEHVANRIAYLEELGNMALGDR